MDNNIHTVGGRILSLRLSRGMTRETLAEKADISVQFLSDIEKGRKSMTINTLRNICNALSVSSDFIINNNTPSNTTNEIFEIVKTLPEQQQKHIKQIILTAIDMCNE